MMNKTAKLQTLLSKLNEQEALELERGKGTI